MPLVLLMGPLGAGPVLAGGVQCRFDRECLEAEACVDTSYAVEILEKWAPSIAKNEEIGGLDVRVRGLFASDQTGDWQALRLTGDASAPVFVWVNATGAHMLTTRMPGPARYTVHLSESADLSILYLGRCEVTP